MEYISIESLLDHFDFMPDVITYHDPDIDIDHKESLELKIKVGKKVGYDIPAYMDFMERYGDKQVFHWMMTAPARLEIFIRYR